MAENTYAIELASIGALSREEAIQALAATFRAPVETAAQLVDSAPLTVKRGVTRDQASSYIKALVDIGVEVLVSCEQTGDVRRFGTAATPTPKPAPTPSTPASTPAPTPAPTPDPTPRTYSIELLGCRGKPAAQVARDLASTFGLPEATAVELLADTPVGLKRGLDESKVKDYVDALVRIGCEILTRCEQTQETRQFAPQPAHATPEPAHATPEPASALVPEPASALVPEPASALVPEPASQPAPEPEIGELEPLTPIMSAPRRPEPRVATPDEPPAARARDGERSDETPEPKQALPGWARKAIPIVLVAAVLFLGRGMWTNGNTRDRGPDVPIKSVVGTYENDHTSMELRFKRGWKHWKAKDWFVKRMTGYDLYSSVFFLGDNASDARLVLIVTWVPDGGDFDHDEFSVDLPVIASTIDDMTPTPWDVTDVACDSWGENAPFVECTGTVSSDTGYRDMVLYWSDMFQDLVGFMFLFQEDYEEVSEDIDHVWQNSKLVKKLL